MLLTGIDASVGTTEDLMNVPISVLHLKGRRLMYISIPSNPKLAYVVPSCIPKAVCL